ncbi:MAG TPA: YceI family protein [Acidimicrobiia bacterium]|nr:YceI family protein [Acidimicrobiia bacterium]
MRRAILWVLASVLVIGGGAVAYLYLAGGSGEPSTELTTPSLATGTTTTEDSAPDTTPPEAPSAFVIDAAQSTATFEIDEVLRGSPQRVIGTTSELAGQIQVDPSDLATVEFSPIVVNARTFQTGSGNRDRAIRGPVILNSASDEFELITFDVTTVDGLSGSLAIGEPVSFTVGGDLLIRDTTTNVTFEVSATLVDESTIEGSAESTVLRSDYGIGIPSAPGVADVGDEVVIRLDFVATS